jgi:Dyp-type peroxidase family
VEAATGAAELDPSNIQGNLAGFNKDHQRFLLLNFPNKASAQAFLTAIVGDIATCAEVRAFNEVFRLVRARRASCPETNTVEATWLNLALSFAGLGVLEAPDLESLPEEFRAGMRARAAAIGDADESAHDSDTSAWIEPFKTGQVHAIAILAADDPDDLEEETTHVRRHLTETGVTELAAIDGNTRQGQPGHEHFGFKDGVSQPTIEGITSPAKPGEDVLPAGEFILGHPDLGQAAPLPPPVNAYNPVQPPAPPGAPEWTKDGSYLVFRRLRQDVQGFKDFVAREAPAHELTEERLGAKLVGRYDSGAPLERTHDQGPDFDPEVADPADADPSILDDARIDNFDYDADPDGRLVPRAAHIRKTNPRSATPPGKEESNRHRILRRGVPYGPEFSPGEAAYGQGLVPDNQDRGLLFLCYQASIARGFEFVQSQWANQDGFPQAEDGRDPIISQDVAEPKFTLPRDPEALHLTLSRWVITTGGEYFLSPSIAALKSLSGQP